MKVLELDDYKDFDLAPYIDKAHMFIDSGLKRDEGVLVVCTAGISRSASIVISYLIKTHKLTYDKAYETVKKARVYIKPNEGFERFLR